MKCKYCGSENIIISTSMRVTMPYEYRTKSFDEKIMQSKDFKVHDVFWDNPAYICKECGNVLNPEVLY